MINDEFVIDKSTFVGSEGGELVKYYLEFHKERDLVVDLSFDELKRLSLFLNEYIKKEGGEK